MTEMSMERRIHLSVADVGQLEHDYVLGAMTSGWVTTVGPDSERFEEEFASSCLRKYAVVLSSGTAALHLAYKSMGLEKNDEVIIPTVTFGATVFPANYLGARPIFIDVDPHTLTIDIEKLSNFLAIRNKIGKVPKAIVPVDLYGTPCDYQSLNNLSSQYGIPLICDAAEAAGSSHSSGPIGLFGDCSIFSFNGNKIMTTSGGGMLLTDNQAVAEKVRFWSTQSREKVPWYEHKEAGYNYRLSNILAALGRAQLVRLPEFVAKRRQIRSWYKDLLAEIEGMQVLQDPPWGESNAWLTVVFFDIDIYPNAPVRIREALERENIESRPLWKPMHQQPVFSGTESFLNGTSDKLFERGLCLPSSSSLTQEDVSRVCKVIISEIESMRRKVKS